MPTDRCIKSLPKIFQMSYFAAAPTGHIPQHLSSIFSCFSDRSVCCSGFFCPCFMISKTAERISGKPNCAVCFGSCLCLPCFSLWERGLVREKYGLQEQCCADFLAAFCCSPCSVCQEFREVELRSRQQTYTSGTVQNFAAMGLQLKK
ncbi:hypothetical protein PAPYR_4504 [Paratrimastix pyriformis]|uniref:Uncharacterized protein n=1 Tax=Paratrimastix pyriformis TaxID=342808 RepID=A0ABQ8ULX3_9EUKA|nr:hypothetical protein PAPYR_4504 [Paratrimastix pyriformis]